MENNNHHHHNNNNSNNNSNNNNSNTNLDINFKPRNASFSCNLLSVDQCDMTSLEILNKCHLDLFPKKKTIYDDKECMSMSDQLPTLNGEYVHFIGNQYKRIEIYPQVSISFSKLILLFDNC